MTTRPRKCYRRVFLIWLYEIRAGIEMKANDANHGELTNLHPERGDAFRCGGGVDFLFVDEHTSSTCD